MHYFLKTIIILVCLIGFSAQADEQTPKTLEELKTAIEKIRQDTNTPAIGIALVNKEGPYWIAGLGEANIETATKADENTLFRIGSVSKMFAALAVLKLQEEGKLNLNDCSFYGSMGRGRCRRILCNGGSVFRFGGRLRRARMRGKGQTLVTAENEVFI